MGAARGDVSVRSPLSSAARLVTPSRSGLGSTDAYMHPNPLFDIERGFRSTSPRVSGRLTILGKRAFVELHDLLNSVSEKPKELTEMSQVVGFAAQEGFVRIDKGHALKINTLAIGADALAALAESFERTGVVKENYGREVAEILGSFLMQVKGGEISKSDLLRALKEVEVITNKRTMLYVLTNRGVLEERPKEEIVLTNEGARLILGIEQFLKIAEGEAMSVDRAVERLAGLVGPRNAELAFQILKWSGRMVHQSENSVLSA